MVTMKKLDVIIKTIENGEEKTSKYEYDGDLNIPVTTLLEKINYDYDKKIHYSSSCLQGLCGSCTMLINGWPKLACKTFINEEITTKYYNKITIEPLSKFPVIKDLIIDRTQLYENMKESQQWLESEAKINLENLEFEYELSQCIMCGCCLEACPNYTHDNKHYGVILPVSQAKISKQETNKQQLDFHEKNYNKHFFNHCVKSLVCEDVCPMNIKTQRAISVMNHENVWKIREIIEKIKK